MWLKAIVSVLLHILSDADLLLGNQARNNSTMLLETQVTEVLPAKMVVCITEIRPRVIIQSGREIQSSLLLNWANSVFTQTIIIRKGKLFQQLMQAYFSFMQSQKMRKSIYK